MKRHSIFERCRVTQKSISHSFPDNNKIGDFVVYLGGYKGLWGRIRGLLGNLGGLSSRFSSLNLSWHPITQPNPILFCRVSQPSGPLSSDSKSNIILQSLSTSHDIQSPQPSSILFCRVSQPSGPLSSDSKSNIILQSLLSSDPKSNSISAESPSKKIEQLFI